MASGKMIDLKLEGFEKFKKITGKSRFAKIMRKNLALGTRRGAQLVQREVRKAIKAGKYAKNAPLTTALKGSSKPLVDDGDLFGAITIHQKNWNEAFIGILKSDGAYNLAETLHEGATIPVTEKMRGLFYVLWMASQARKNGNPEPPLSGRAAELFALYQDWKPLKQETRMIKIPARKFIQDVFENAAVKKGVIEKWERALELAFKELKEGK